MKVTAAEVKAVGSAPGRIAWLGEALPARDQEKLARISTVLDTPIAHEGPECAHHGSRRLPELRPAKMEQLAFEDGDALVQEHSGRGFTFNHDHVRYREQ